MKPIFGFLWPERTPAQDGAARQDRLIRIPSRGPLRIALLVTATLVAIMLIGSVILAAAGIGWPMIVLSAVVIATIVVLLLRAWVVGTYVNDDGFAVQRMFGVDVVRWSDVWQIEIMDGHLHIRLLDGSMVGTHLSRRNLDLFGRPTAYDMAILRFERWREAR